MFMHKALLAAALVAVYAVVAAPAPEPKPEAEDLIILETKVTPVGTLTYYGLAPGANETTPALSARACGSNDVKCDGAHVPPVNTCADLISAIGASSRILPNSPRSICLSNGGTCCVSWHNVVPNLPENFLFNAAVDARNVCIVNGLSGATDNTLLNGVCTRQCLSNRATGC